MLGVEPARWDPKSLTSRHPGPASSTWWVSLIWDVALSWAEGETTDLMVQLIGVVRGRTVNSTRGHQGDQAQRKQGQVP